jgi:hypothetical protein
MQKFMTAFFIFLVLIFLQNQTFASTLNCNFKSEKVEGVQTIHISDESLIINNELEIPLEESRVKCGHFGRQTRFDGRALGYQVVLKTCTTDAKLEGYLFDSIKIMIAEVTCNPI